MRRALAATHRSMPPVRNPIGHARTGQLAASLASVPSSAFGAHLTFHGFYTDTLRDQKIYSKVEASFLHSLWRT